MGEKRERTQKEGNEAFLKKIWDIIWEKNLAQALTTKSRKERPERLSAGLKVKY